MALMERLGRLLLCLVAGLLVSCHSGATVANKTVRIDDPPMRPGLPLVLVLMPVFEATAQLHDALVGEVSCHFNIVTVSNHDLGPAKLGGVMEKYSPAAVVLIDNASVNLYRQYQRLEEPRVAFPPALVLMAAFAEESRRSVRNASAISYEVPSVTAIVALRRLLKPPVRRVGVVYRKAFVAAIERNRSLARLENVELVDAPVGAEPSATDLRRALRTLVSGADPVDALWVPNDNVLLSSTLLRDTWLPTLREYRKPVIVGVESLVNPELGFGSLAVLPDLDAMGLQAGQHLVELSRRDWQVTPSVEPPVSVITVVNGPQAYELFDVRGQALDRIDRVLN